MRRLTLPTLLLASAAVLSCGPGPADGAAVSQSKHALSVNNADKAPTLDEPSSMPAAPAPPKPELLDGVEETSVMPAPPAASAPPAAKPRLKNKLASRLPADSKKAGELKEVTEAEAVDEELADDADHDDGFHKRADVADLVNGLSDVTEKRRKRRGQRLSKGITSGKDRRASAQQKPRRHVAKRFQKPAHVLPRMFYFEPTYVGGNAGMAERFRRLEADLPDARQRLLRLSEGYPQDFDAPLEAGLALSARLETPQIDRPQRVLLQVGLQGSTRFGWRRPPLDVVMVLDEPLLRGSRRAASGLIRAAMKRLGVLDRLGVVAVSGGGRPTVIAPVQRISELNLGLERMIDQLPADGQASGRPAEALQVAGHMLREASEKAAQVPGTQTVWLVTSTGQPDAIQQATHAADALTRAGVVTSVVEISPTQRRQRGQWWSVASKGHGNYHRPRADNVADALSEELSALSRVVARLVRINVRMGSDVGAVRVVGSRVLDPDEVKRLKAREKAVDIALSKTLGVAADRGHDDDGIQTNIPYFYGGDSHVILIELWVEKPGHVADVTVTYKDMVNMTNATARVAVAMGAGPERVNEDVAQNGSGFQVAEQLIRAGYKVKHRRTADALGLLRGALTAASTPRERRLVTGFIAWLEDGPSHQLSETLVLAGRRQIGQSAPSLGGFR